MNKELYAFQKENNKYSDKNERSQSKFYIGVYPPQMFIELQELVPRVEGGLQFDDDTFSIPVAAHFKVLWLETARWVNFEENFNELEQRFTEAHVSPMKVLFINQLRQQMHKYLTIIPTDAITLGQALDEVANLALSSGYVANNEQYDVLRAILLAERWHPDVKGHISDAAEFDQYWTGSLPEGVNPAFENDEEKWTVRNLQNKLDPKQRASICVTELRPKLSIGSNEHGTRALSNALSIHNQSRHPYHRFNQPLTNCLMSGSEACTVISGTIEFLSQPFIVLLRLNNTIQQSCISEVDVPVRFIFVYIGPETDGINFAELSRVFAVMMTNQVFCLNIYDTSTVDDIIKAIDSFMEESLIIPLSRHYNVQALAGMVRQIEAYRRDTIVDRDPDKRLRILLSSKKPSQVELSNIINGSQKPSLSLKQIESATKVEGDLPQVMEIETLSVNKSQRFIKDFCPPFIDFARGLRPWIQRMPSDYKDAFKKDNIGIVLGSVLFIYFVNLSPAITFAALLNTQVDQSYTVTLTLLATGIYIMLFTILAGQPLAIIGISAPTFIVEAALVSVSKSTGVDFKQLRCLTALYAALCGFIFVAFNLSVVANHVRRSVEEVYNSFIGFFFLLKALFTMFMLIPRGPVNSISSVLYYRKLAIAGVTLFLAFIMLQFCLILAELKRGTYFRRTIRKLLGALNVPLGMLLITALERIFFRDYNLPTVNIPPSNQINVSLWINPPNFAKLADHSKAPVSLIHGMSFAIGVALAVIIFTEVSLNGLTAMKNKAVKPNVFVIDLVIMQVLFPIISGLTGWPFVSGTTVRTLSNLVALVKMDQTPAPGMPHKIIGTVEQRVSGIFVGILVALSIFLGSILSFIPLAALYGMFLYMGVMGLRDLQFVLRILSLMKRRKHWEDWECVRGLPSRHILVFALIQAFVVAILVSLNIISDFTVANYLGIVFPIIIFFYGILREFILPRWKWLATYLHQLDRKHKLNPSVIRKTTSVVRNLSMVPKESRASFASAMNVTSQLKTNNLIIEHDLDSEYSEEGSEHEDGVVRRTWAT